MGVSAGYLSESDRGDDVVKHQATLALAKDRDSAVTALFVVHHARLVGLARLLVDDLPTAEDVVQDAFASLYRRWFWIRDKPSALYYLQASVANGARSSLRRRRTARVALLEPATATPSAESTVVEADDARALRAALTRLPLRQRQVVVLRYYLDWSEREIADTLGISRGSVKQHTSRAMAALSSQLEAAR
jgi:RNA polymerase sigma-70 factor (sigma-E family)